MDPNTPPVEQSQPTITSISPPPEHNNFKVILLVVFTAILLICVGIFFYANRSPSGPIEFVSPTSPPVPTGVAVIPTVGIENYQNSDHGFSFQYLADAQLETCSGGTCVNLKKYGIHIDLADKKVSTGKFETDIAAYASSLCKSAVPSVKVECSLAQVKVEPFVNEKQIAGYKVTREKRSTEEGETTVDTDTVYAYPLTTDQTYFAVVLSADSPDNGDKLAQLSNTFISK